MRTLRELQHMDLGQAQDRAGIVINRPLGSIDLLWDGADYPITFDRLDTERKVLAWVWTLCGKSFMTLDRMELFLDACATLNHWPKGWQHDV